jgi:ParB-like chromosome segregation protein Spo0J
MCTSIREFGFAVAMLCRSTGEIVDGHVRFKGARKIGLSELPVVLLRSLVRGAGASIQAAGQPLRRLGRVG